MKVQLTPNNIIERNVSAVLARRLITRPASTFIMNLEKYGVLVETVLRCLLKVQSCSWRQRKVSAYRELQNQASPRRTCGAW